MKHDKNNLKKTPLAKHRPLQSVNVTLSVLANIVQYQYSADTSVHPKFSRTINLKNF